MCWDNRVKSKKFVMLSSYMNTWKHSLSSQNAMLAAQTMLRTASWNPQKTFQGNFFSLEITS